MNDDEIEELIQDLLRSTEHCPARDVIAAGLIANQRARINALQEDLDQAVGYRLAVREQTRGETKGDQDRDV